jgi:T4 bacteriophage base plate protein
MLPKIDMPVYDIKIPSNGQSISVRPFTVKEEKLLLMAMESKDVDEVIKTVKQIINNCLIKGKVDIDKLPFFDIDFLFVFLRGKSVGDTVEIQMTCHNVLKDGSTCGNVFETDMDISKCEVEYKDGITNDIKLSAKQGVKMKYPSYSSMRRIESNNQIDNKVNVIVNSIEHIYDEKGIYSWKDYSKDELKDFVEGLTEENFNKLQDFVDNFPTMIVTLDGKCTKCGFEHHVRYTDFYDFFT